MKTLLFLISLCWSSAAIADEASVCDTNSDFAVVIHGGAGLWHIPAEQREIYKSVFTSILTEAKARLASGQPGLDVIEYSIKAMEDSGYFNAGKGSIATREGVYELDAAIMEGESLKAGAVAAVKTIKNPITAARAVMERTPHVLLVADGADFFARDQGLDIVDQDYFESRAPSFKKFGTVGAVVLDRCGTLYAGTSTGGYKGKMAGRVGDSPLIGAGTYSDNNGAAVSATGHGEFFIRYNVAGTISTLVAKAGYPLQQAADHLVKEELARAGGEGGVIALDKFGEIAISFNTPALLHGYVNKQGELRVEF